MSRRQKDLFPELPDGKKFISDIPELVAEWHPTLNGDLSPKTIKAATSKILWWRCDNGHEWQAKGSAMRTRANLCQNCKAK